MYINKVTLYTLYIQLQTYFTVVTTEMIEQKNQTPTYKNSMN